MFYVNEKGRKKHCKMWGGVFTFNGLLHFSPTIIMMLPQL